MNKDYRTIKQQIKREMIDKNISSHELARKAFGGKRSSVQSYLKDKSKSINTSSLDKILDELGLEVQRKSNGK